MIDSMAFSEIQNSPYLSPSEKHNLILQLAHNAVDAAQPVMTNGFLWLWTLGGFVLFALCLAVRYAIDMSAIRSGQYVGLTMSRGGYGGGGSVVIINANPAPPAILPTSPAYYRAPVVDCDRVQHSVFR